MAMSYFIRELSDNTVTLVTESGRTVGVFVDLDDAASSLVEEVLDIFDSRYGRCENEPDLIA
jgi:hypothetical protein